jgi:hypothetical protein
MKLGLLVMSLLFVAASAARADSSRVDHAAAIEHYREAYAASADPALLVQIGREYRLAGNARDALAYFCSYLYVDAMGELADEASQNAREVAASLGNVAQSDHDVCSAPTRTSQVALAPVLSATTIPPRITKREVAGLTVIGASIASLGIALFEAHKVTQIKEDIGVAHTNAELDALAERRDAASLREKLFLGIGGAALLTGSILYITGHADRMRAEKAYVAPSLTKNGGGLVLGGRF